MDSQNLLSENLKRRYQKQWHKLLFLFMRLNWTSRSLPDFLIIGAQKGGTSSLHTYLSQHPQLFPSPLKKEVHFFDISIRSNKTKDNFGNGESWYRAHFPIRKNLGSESKVYESTPSYFHHRLVPGRIHSLIPDVKLIVLLRNPSERAISHYFMSRRKKLDTLPMLEAFQMEEYRLEKATMMQNLDHPSFTDHSYKSRGIYAEQLLRYLEFFSRQQFLILNSEEFFRNPLSSLKRVYEFLDVETGIKINDLAPRNVGRGKSSVPIEARIYLDDYFRPYNQSLYELIGVDFHW